MKDVLSGKKTPEEALTDGLTSYAIAKLPKGLPAGLRNDEDFKKALTAGLKDVVSGKKTPEEALADGLTAYAIAKLPQTLPAGLRNDPAFRKAYTDSMTSVLKGEKNFETAVKDGVGEYLLLKADKLIPERLRKNPELQAIVRESAKDLLQGKDPETVLKTATEKYLAKEIARVGGPALKELGFKSAEIQALSEKLAKATLYDEHPRSVLLQNLMGRDIQNVDGAAQKISDILKDAGKLDGLKFLA
jgi:hypothetical protein